MKIHAISRMPHYGEHLAAIWKRLHGDIRGEWVHGHEARRGRDWHPTDLVMVAAYSDIPCAGEHRVIYVEHGAGQRYEGVPKRWRGYYHGDPHPANVVAYLGPRQDVIDAWGRPGFACGSPVCDPYQLFPEPLVGDCVDEPLKIAVITFHHNPMVTRWVPEAGSAFDHYAPRMPDIIAALQREGYTVWGHRHPRFNHLRGYWDRHGIYEASVDEVRRHASLLIADNTSLLYEMMYLWRDFVALDCPEYRRDVEHGLRFWEHVPSWHPSDPEELIAAIPEFTEGGTTLRSLQPEYVYGAPHCDGGDGQRAAMWLNAFASSL